ncbi:hypothetical protein [Salinispora mooreana]|nr:hypothetical protein [Salinispora mooreana]
MIIEVPTPYRSSEVSHARFAIILGGDVTGAGAAQGLAVHGDRPPLG